MSQSQRCILTMQLAKPVPASFRERERERACAREREERERERERERGTEAQRHRGTEAQRHRGTEAQRHRGTEAQRHREITLPHRFRSQTRSFIPDEIQGAPTCRRNQEFIPLLRQFLRHPHWAAPQAVPLCTAHLPCAQDCRTAATHGALSFTCAAEGGEVAANNIPAGRCEQTLYLRTTTLQTLVKEKKKLTHAKIMLSNEGIPTK